MRALKAGVIGLGVGERHGAAYQAEPGCELVALCDLDEKRLKEVGDRLGVAERHTDWRRITEHPELDVISICSYDDCHAEQAVSAFRHGKHVMVEKPAALHRAEAEAMLRAMTDSKRLITSNLILRKSPRFIAVRDMIRDGRFGEIFYLEGDYIHEILWKIVTGWRGRMPFYCVTYGGGIHLIDLMRWLMGQEIVEVSGMGNKLASRGADFPYPDTIVNLMRFEGGALAKSLTTFAPQRPQIHALSIYGSRATFVNDMPNAKLFGGSKPEDETPMRAPYPAIEKGALLPDFLAAIREGREPEIGARDIFRVMDVCFAAWESVEAGHTVKVSYLI